MALVGTANSSLKLEKKSCMSSDDLVQLRSDHGSPGLRTHFLLTGFPASKGTIKRRTNELESKMWSLLCREGKLEDYESLGFDPVHFLLLRLDNKNLTQNGQRVTAPDLHGVSGSPIWIIGSEGLEQQIPGNCVAGFAIEHPPPSSGESDRRRQEWRR